MALTPAPSISMLVPPGYVPAPSPAALTFQHSLEITTGVIGALLLVALVVTLSALRPMASDVSRGRARRLAWLSLLGVLIALAVFAAINYAYIHDFIYPPILPPT